MVDRAALDASPITPAQAAAFIRGRRSVDQFTDDIPDAGLIREAVEIARWAPNHHLTQPWRFYVLGPQSIEKVIDLNTRLVAERKDEEVAENKRARWRTMPGWLLMTCQINSDDITAREDFAACGCAVQNLMLYLHAVGLASKWISGDVTRHPDLLPMLDIDSAREYCIGVLWYGYPKRRPRSQRSDIERILLTRP